MGNQLGKQTLRFVRRTFGLQVRLFYRGAANCVYYSLKMCNSTGLSGRKARILAAEERARTPVAAETANRRSQVRENLLEELFARAIPQPTEI